MPLSPVSGSTPRIAALVVSLTAGLGLLLFAGILHFGGCGSCATSLPLALVVGDGLAWIAVAALIGGRRPGIAFLAALLLVSTHVFLIAFLNARPCVPCLAFLAVESAGTILLAASQIPMLRSPSPSRRILLGSAAASMLLLGAGIAGLISRDAASRPAVVLRSGRGDRDLKAYIIVRRNCAVCQEAERRISQALEEGLPASEAIIVEEGSEVGARLVKTLDLDTFPAFVAIRNGSVIRAQSGGSVETFVRSLSP